MMMDYQAIRHPDDTIEFTGIDFSNGSKPLRVIKPDSLSADYLVIKHPGGSCWNGNGNPWKHVPVSFLVFHITSVVHKKNKDTHYSLVQIADIPTKAK